MRSEIIIFMSFLFLLHPFIFHACNSELIDDNLNNFSGAETYNITTELMLDKLVVRSDVLTRSDLVTRSDVIIAYGDEFVGRSDAMTIEGTPYIMVPRPSDPPTSFYEAPELSLAVLSENGDAELAGATIYGNEFRYSESLPAGDYSFGMVGEMSVFSFLKGIEKTVVPISYLGKFYVGQPLLIKIMVLTDINQIASVEFYDPTTREPIEVSSVGLTGDEDQNGNGVNDWFETTQVVDDDPGEGGGGGEGEGEPPVHKAQAVSFTDVDLDEGEIGGTITITKALDESDITYYVIRTGKSETEPLSANSIELPATGADVTYLVPMNSKIFDSVAGGNITHALVFTKNSYGEMSEGISIPVEDATIRNKNVFSKSFGGCENGNQSCNIKVHSSALDSSGNYYITGVTQAEPDFGGGYLDMHGNFDVFVAKFNSSGEHVWSKTFGGVGSSTAGKGIAVDNSGNVYVIGTFGGATDTIVNFGGGDLSTGDITDKMFILKLNSSGEHVWSKAFGSIHTDSGNSITTDTSGNVYFTGIINDSTDFGGYVLEADIERPRSFIVKLNSDGAHVWSRTFGNGFLYNVDVGLSIIADSANNILVTGSTWVWVYVDGEPWRIQPGTVVAKIDNMGNDIWEKIFGGEHEAYGYAVRIDKEDSIYIIGRFDQLIAFGDFTLTSGEIQSTFVVKLGSNAGDVVWANGYDGLHLDDGPPFEGNGFGVDGLGNLYIAGYYTGTITIGDYTFASENSSEDILFFKLDENGNISWMSSFGGTESDRSRNVSIDTSGNMFLLGNFISPTINFGGDNLQHIGTVNENAFFVKFAP